MFTKEAIELLSRAQAITAANNETTGDHPIALPSDFALHDLEPYSAQRRRPRGTMTTSVAEHFALYAKEHQEEGAAVFVDGNAMSATAVLNMGTSAKPGHADNLAVLELESTAPFDALLRVNGNAMGQTQASEFIEDWADRIVCMDADGGLIETKKAVAAVRRITIEALKKVESSEQTLRADRSTFESVAASSVEPIPAMVQFSCVPYLGLAPRKFVMRLSVRTSDKPQLLLRVVSLEREREEMAQEMRALVGGAVASALPVYVGAYQRKN